MVIIDFLVVGPVSPRAKVPLPGTGPCRSQSHHGARLGGSVYTRNAMARLPLTQQEGPTVTKPKGAPGRAVSVDTENLRLAQANPKEEPLQRAVSLDTSSGQTPQKSGVGQAPLALSSGVEGSEPSTGQTVNPRRRACSGRCHRTPGSCAKWSPRRGFPQPVRGRSETEVRGLLGLSAAWAEDTDRDSLLVLQLMYLVSLATRGKMQHGRAPPGSLLEHPRD